MSENLKTSGSDIDGRSPIESQPVGGLSSDVLARRRMLLASLGKGAAVAAAVAVPMRSLAALSVTRVDGKRCTISGTMSGVHSKETITATCAGLKPSTYDVSTLWPGKVNKKAAFNTVFTSSSVTTTLIDIVQTAPTSDNAYWIAAYLNAQTGSPASNFPYTPTEVVNFFNGPNIIKGSALNFFITYMSTL